TAPGGGALVLMGKVRDVEEVEGWIHELDATATTGEKTVKIFDLGDADVEQVADTLMAVLDSGAVKGPRAPAKPKDDALDFGFFESTITRQGKDLYISADKFAGTMLIAALPAKMREVDELVERITGDPEIVTAMGGGDGEKPFRTYELQYADAFDAVYTLEQIIDAVWAFEDKPSIDYIPFTNILVIKGNPERFGDVEDLIIKYVDKGTARPPVSRAIDSTFGSGMTASNLALLLKARLEATGLNVDVNQINPEEPSSKLEQVHPCLLPPALFGDLGAIAVGQTAPDEPAAEVNEDVDNEQAAIEALLGQALADDPGSGSADSDASSDAPEEEPPPSLTIRVDDKTGTIYLEGSSTAIDDATELIKTIKEDAKDLPAPPDIRIFRLKYVDVNQAAEVLETMFNDRQLRAQQQQMQRAMQQAQRQRQRQQQQEQQKGQDGRRGQQPGQQPGQQQPQAQQQMPQLTVRVYPNPRARTIIIRAATEVFPSIEDLLATIDKKATEPLDYKLFPLEHRVAAEVEEQIKAMFGLGQSRGGARRPQRGGQQRSAQGGGQGIIQMEVPGGGSGALSTQDMSVTSNASTNTVMVMAPAEAMEQVERFINDLEAQDAPEFVTETYKLKHADAAEVLPQLEKMFKRAGGRGGAGSKGGIDPGDVNAPVFMADGRSNAIIVRALEIDLPKIAPLIEQLDVETPIDTVTDYVLVNADATQVAKTLTQLFGKTGGGRRAAAGGSAKAVTIVADAESNVIFATAPPEIQEQIAQRIATIEEEAGEKTKPRVIKVTMGTPSDIAKKIEEALGAKGKRGKPRFQIVGDDVGKQLIVRAPDEVVGDIESLVQILDKPPTGVDIKIYPLEHARAKETLQGLNQMVNQAKGQLARSNVHMDLFSATADERSNALVVMGGPMTFMLIEKILKDLDVPPRDPTQVVTKMYQLVNAKAADLARNINNIYRGRKEKGVEPPKAEANASSNTLLVRGTKAQIEEIDRDIIGPAEEAVVTATDELRDERIPLTYAKADEVAQVLTQRFNDKFRAIKLAGIKNIKPAELTVSITPEVNSNALLVTASEANLAYITAILPSIDLEDIGTKTATTTKIYPLTYADPNNVANVINSAYRKQGKVAQKDRVQAVVEWGTQSVVVIASAENQEKITELVGELDVDTGSGQVRQVYKLKEARASDVAAIIDRTLRGSRRTNRRGQLPVSVVANDALNSLVISGTQKDYDAILPLIEELDRKPEEMTGLVVRVYQLKYADPGSTMGTINSAFPRLRGQTPEDTVRAAYAHGTAALVVSASVENQEKVEDLLAQIDIESTSERSVHLVALEHANADDLARNLGQLFGRTKRRQRDEQPISFTSEPGSNTLMVYANELELEEILPLLKSLDVKPEFEKDRIFKSFKLTYAESWGVRRMIDDSFRLPGRNRNPRDIVTSMEDWGSNSIVVTASPEKMEQVEKLIAEVDRQGAGQRQVHVVTIEHADPEAVNQALGQIFVQGGRGRRGPTVSISNPRGSDTLLIKANETEFAEIQQVIVDLDKSEAEIGGEIEVIQLKHTNAGETLEILQEYLRKPGGRGGRGGRGGELVGDIRLSAAESINAIVVSGDRDEIDHLVEIVATIDVEMEDDQAAPKIIRLQHAQASELEQSLTTVFAEQRGGRRGGRRGGAATMVPIIVGNDATNTLIVRASAVDYRRIEELVAEMDTEEAGAGADMKILTLQPGVNATEMAELIDGLLEEQAQNQRSSGGRRRSSPVQRVFVRADVRTNSLILSGPQSKFDEVEALVEELANIGPRGGTVSMVIPIKNADPAEIKQLIDQVVSESQSGGSSSRRGGRRRR
ncbi:MAG: hypothetical protein GY778_24895, partial [bacterium]|nr:hypothetical protein [bacterium]